MRNSFLVIFFTLFIIACSEENKDLIITLNVSNYSKDYLIFVKDTSGYGLSYYVDTIRIDTDGGFKIRTKSLNSTAFINLQDSTEIRLTIPKILYGKIDVELDMQKPDSITIFGKQAPFIQYYFDQHEYWKNIYYEMADKYPELASRNNQSPIYHALQDTITQLRMQYLYDYFENVNIADKKKFIDEEYNSLLYSNLYYRMSGQPAQIINSLAFYQQSKAENDKILTYSDKVDFSDANLLSITSFKDFVNDFIMNAVRVENPDSDISSYEFYLRNGLNVIEKWFDSPQIRILQKIIFIDYLVETAKIFKGNLNIYEYQKVIENLRKNEFAKNYCDVLDQKLQELNKSLTKLSPGVIAPDFELQDKQGKIYKLSDFENQIMIIDVWASWCGKCISSFPAWNSLVEKYSKKENIHFMTVSADDSPEKWQSTLQKYKPNGIQLYVGEKGFDSQFIKSFEIVAIPQCIIIDQESKIISIVTSIKDIEKALQDIE